MNTETTALTVPERAAIALGSSKAETELIALAAQSKDITVITNGDGRDECHAAAMVAKQARISIERTAKTAREDATLFSKAVIAEGNRLVELIAPEESRLLALRDEWDAKIAREKAAKAEAERLIIVEIMGRIAEIKNLPILAATKNSEAIAHQIGLLELLEIDDSFKQFFGEASEAKSVTLDKLREMHAAKERAERAATALKELQEAEAQRLQAEREELTRQRAEQEARTAAAAKQIADEAAHQKNLRDAEEARLDGLRKREEERIQAQRDDLARQQKAIDEQRQAQEQQARDQAELAKQVPAVTPAPEFSQPMILSGPMKSVPLGNVRPMISDLIVNAPVVEESMRHEIYSNVAEQLAGLSDDELTEAEPLILHCIERVKAQRAAA